MRRILPWLFVCFTYFGFAQDDETLPEQELNATVVNAQTDFPLESVHVINLNKVLGTITNEDGKFSITASVNDTLYLTYLGFKPQKIRVTNDMFKFDGTRLALTELAYALEEVVEPFLLQQGLIQRTPRGRMLARKAWQHLGLSAPKGEATLFDE